MIINGPINSGKSTVAKLLAILFPAGIYLEGDDLVIQQDLSFELWIETTVKRAVEQAITFVQQNKLPIIAFPLRKEDWSMISSLCKIHEITPVCITLAPNLEVALSMRKDRMLQAEEKKRIKEMYNEGYHSREFSALIIQNNHESPEETAHKIQEFLSLTYCHEPVERRIYTNNGGI